MSVFECFPNFVIGMFVERIQVHTQRAGEQYCVLWDDGETRTEIVQAHISNILTVYNNFTIRCFNNSKNNTDIQFLFVYTSCVCSYIYLNKARVKLLFPAPVRPTIPTFSPPLTSKDTFFNTRSKPSRYLTA